MIYKIVTVAMMAECAIGMKRRWWSSWGRSAKAKRVRKPVLSKVELRKRRKRLKLRKRRNLYKRACVEGMSSPKAVAFRDKVEQATGSLNSPEWTMPALEFKKTIWEVVQHGGSVDTGSQRAELTKRVSAIYESFDWERESENCQTDPEKLRRVAVAICNHYLSSEDSSMDPGRLTPQDVQDVLGYLWDVESMSVFPWVLDLLQGRVEGLRKHLPHEAENRFRTKLATAALHVLGGKKISRKSLFRPPCVYRNNSGGYVAEAIFNHYAKFWVELEIKGSSIRLYVGRRESGCPTQSQWAIDLLYYALVRRTFAVSAVERLFRESIRKELEKAGLTEKAQDLIIVREGKVIKTKFPLLTVL